MGLLRVSSCCGCNSLQSGCIKIAWVNIVFSVLGIVGSFGGPNAVYNALGSILGLVANVCLLHGVKTDKRPMVLVWLVISGIQLAMTVVLTIFVIFMAAFIGTIDPNSDDQPRTGIDSYNDNYGGGDNGKMMMDTLNTYLLDENTRDNMKNNDVEMKHILGIFEIALWTMAVMFIVVDAIYCYLFLVVLSYHDEMKTNESNLGVVAIQHVDNAAAMEAGFPAIPQDGKEGAGYMGVPSGPPPAYDEVNDMKKTPY